MKYLLLYLVVNKTNRMLYRIVVLLILFNFVLFFIYCTKVFKVCKFRCILVFLSYFGG